MKKIVTLLLCLAIMPAASACGSHSGTSAPPQAPVNPIQETQKPLSDHSQAVEAYTSLPVNLTPDAVNFYPYMGVTLHIPEKLLDAVLDNIVFMRSEDSIKYTDIGNEISLPADWQPTPEHTHLYSGALKFRFVPEEIRDRTPHIGMEDPMDHNEYLVWLSETEPMARLEMHCKDEFQESMMDQNGYTRHKKLGETKEYIYYLSWNEAGHEQAGELFALLPELESHITLEEPRQIDSQFFGLTTPEVKEITQIGEFQTTTISGNAIDQMIFADKKLTMIHVWTTWCGSCVDEMPELEKLSNELNTMDAQMISICSDTADARGQIDEELLELARQIIEKTGVTFPTLLPDQSLHNGLLKGILGYPTTFFADRQGRIVGEPVLGANSAEDWLKIVQERLTEVKK